MKANLAVLKTGADTLRRQLDLFDEVLKLNRVNAAEVQPAGAAKQILEIQSRLSGSADLARFCYNATIVSLYGLLERYIENLIAEAVRRVAELVPRYDLVPEKIRFHHLPLTLEVLSHIGTGRYQGETSESELIRGLYSCTSDTIEFALNDS